MSKTEKKLREKKWAIKDDAIPPSRKPCFWNKLFDSFAAAKNYILESNMSRTCRAVRVEVREL